MTVRTRIYTNHTVSQSDAPFQASMMLDDAGAGNVTLIGENGPALTIDATRIGPMIELLKECAELRSLMSMSGGDILLGEQDPSEHF